MAQDFGRRLQVPNGGHCRALNLIKFKFDASFCIMHKRLLHVMATKTQPTSKDQLERLTIYLPQSLKNFYKKEAKNNFRSLNQEIVFSLIKTTKK